MNIASIREKLLKSDSNSVPIAEQAAIFISTINKMAEQQLAKIAEVSDAKQKTDQYKSLIQELAAANNVSGLNAVIDARKFNFSRDLLQSVFVFSCSGECSSGCFSPGHSTVCRVRSHYEA